MFRVLVICSWLMTTGHVCSQISGGTDAPDAYALTRITTGPGQAYAPVLKNGELFFTSDNRSQLGAYFSSADSTTQLSAIYRAKRLNDTLFEKPQLLDKNGSRTIHSGTAWISDDGNRVFFSSNEPTSFLVSTAKEKSPLRIYSMVATGKRWSERVMLPFTEKQANYTHPFLNASEDTLYFASDLPGGYGGYDLYYSVAAAGSWSAPVNLGPEINSAASELFPFAEKGTLVYASNRPGGYGGLDLYSYDPVQQKRTCMAPPFNSPQDDFGFYPVDKRSGYLTSGRTGNDQIYFYKELFPAFENCEPYVKDKFCFTFFEETEELQEGTKLIYEWNLGDGTVIREKEAKHCFAGYGEYLVELNIIDASTDDVFFTESSYPFVIEPTERLHLLGPDTVSLRTAATWSGTSSVLPGYEIGHFYWEADQGRFRKSFSDTVQLIFAEPGVHELILGVTASPEGGGDLQEFCVSKSILVLENYQPAPVVTPKVIPDRLKTVRETDSDEYALFLGVSDTLLRNPGMGEQDVNVEALGDSLYLYSMGTTDNKLSLLEEYRKAHVAGFPDSRVTESQDGKLLHKDELAQTAVVEVETILEDRITEQQVVASSEVFYAYDSYILTEENKQQLTDLAHKNVLTEKHRVLITSFTDSKGNDAYNLALSQKRSETVRNLLVANGYPTELIETENLGKRIPATRSPLTDAQRRKSLIIIYEKY
jgi:outer membrane protein OmpA-like peptidoglycan-associated protein